MQFTVLWVIEKHEKNSTFVSEYIFNIQVKNKGELNSGCTRHFAIAHDAVRAIVYHTETILKDSLYTSVYCDIMIKMSQCTKHRSHVS